MHWMVVAIITVAELMLASTAHAQLDHKQVLVLYSTRRDAQFAAVGENELPRVLDAGLARNLDYYSEFIDITRFPDRAYREGFRDFLQVKYQGVRFDLVIAMQNVAVEFVNDFGRSLFGDVPVVFLTNTAGIRRPSNSTGVRHERNYAATLELIRRLQPDIRNVFIVTGAGAADKEYENEIRRQLPPIDLRLNVTLLSGLPTKQLEDGLSKLPPHSAVYHVLVTEDGAGNKFHPLEYVDRVAAAANAPTYCWVDSAIDHGIVGGSLYSQSDAISRVGQLALRVLAGEAPDSIPVAALNLNRNELDWRQLRRWSIDEARIPKGTLVRFRDPSIWDKYRSYILGALAILLTQTALITTLLIQRKRRQRTEAELRVHQRELSRSYERNRQLGARLLRAQETERSRIAGELHDDICQRMLLLTIELDQMGRRDRDDTPAAEALIVAQDISKSLHELSHRLHPTRLRMIGLVSALDQLCAELSRAGIVIVFTHDAIPSMLPSDVMLCLFRVVQEALQNAIKYSQARDVSVDLRNGRDKLTLTIIDNGVGFDVDTAWGNGVGLVSMIERLDAIGGSLQIDSRPGAGTRVTASVPGDVLHDTDESAAYVSSAPATTSSSSTVVGTP
ncbi:MAG TPA: ATP-binding protein [Vicinamibacterales bacterium]|nr:ATP-binding protein [Vicinamibacterales bacterium]